MQNVSVELFCLSSSVCRVLSIVLLAAGALSFKLLIPLEPQPSAFLVIVKWREC